jgi:hypothetical protein
MGSMDSIFHQASGAWSALCYKAEMEAALRTKGMGGFQLLDLQDFPGQGTALVGILDAFMDSKNVVTPECWKQSCNDVLILLEMKKYCWTNDENFQAEIVVANYFKKTIDSKLGLIFEFRVVKGKLLVCMSQLDKLTDRPEAVQLYHSILDYMDSENFNPGYLLTTEELKAML